MTAAEACLKFVEELPASLAQYLVQQLRSGVTPSTPNPRYQGRIEDFLRRWDHVRHELPPMLEVALAAKLGMQTTELVWSGPSTSAVPRRATEQVLFELIQGARQRCKRQTNRPVDRLTDASLPLCPTCWALGGQGPRERGRTHTCVPGLLLLLEDRSSIARQLFRFAGFAFNMGGHWQITFC